MSSIFQPIVFILGADDPEMREIEEVLKWLDYPYQYATNGGRRVHPGNAYQADRVEFDGDIALIECEPASLSTRGVVTIIDHHRPGDPGYGLPPEQFWYASSLGQLVNFVGKEMELGSHEQLVLAAMDHCPAAAIRGECPGISAEEILELKVQEISKGTGASRREVRDSIAQYSVLIENAPAVDLGGGYVVSDLRSFDTGEGYTLDYLTAQVAALAKGYTVLMLTHDRGDERQKWTVAGHATPLLIETFKDEWAPAQGLVGIYGVPSRGYAGGYLPA